jgi:hypothetical protein
MQKHIADEIKIDRTAFNHAVRGARITKCADYSQLIKSKYSDALKDMGIDAPNGHTTQKQAWELVLEKQEEILRGINQILEHQKKAL